jgi:hypothetical protein
MVYTIILSGVWREDAETPAQLDPVEGTYVETSEMGRACGAYGGG